MTGLNDKRLFHGVLGVSAASIVVFLAAPADSAWQTSAWLAPYVLAAGVLTARVKACPPSARGLLGLLLSGLLASFTASVVWYIWPVGFGYALPFPSPLDAVYIATYVIYGLFLTVLLRRHMVNRSIGNRIALTDSLILSTSLSAVLWVGVIGPHLRQDASGLSTTVAVLYPAFTLLLFGLAARIAISTRVARHVPGLLLLVWIGGEVAADIFYGFQRANDSFDYGGWPMVSWMLSYSALAAMAAHPHLLRLLIPDAGPKSAGRRRYPIGGAMRNNIRLGLLLVAALVPLGLNAFEEELSGGLLVATAVAFVLVTYRMSLFAGDISEQRRLAAQLDLAVGRLNLQRDELARYAAIVDSTDDSIITVTPDGMIVDWNRGADRLYGYNREEALGQHITMISLPEDAESYAATMAIVPEQDHASLETVQRRKDGSTVETSVTLSNIYDETGEVIAIVGIARDISDHKAREAELNQNSKLESLGRLSAGLAHEINSPIQFVGDNTRFLAEAYQELIRVVLFYRELLDSANPMNWTERLERMRVAEAGIEFEYLQKEIPSAVEQSLEGIERVSTIVRAMKTFSHPGHEEQVPADLNEALEATVTVTRNQVSDVADLSLELSDLPPVRCNIADLNQVFLNLIVNAAHAVEEAGRRGTIEVTTAVEGEHVIVRISDTGTGIPDDVRPKIFDPFFTTKDVGRGSGQGLSLARAVVQEGHGGILAVESTPGHGSTFTVRLPVDGRAGAELAQAGV
jgi:two-component system NtrC family sensor kinase